MFEAGHSPVLIKNGMVMYSSAKQKLCFTILYIHKKRWFPTWQKETAFYLNRDVCSDKPWFIVFWNPLGILIRTYYGFHSLRLPHCLLKNADCNFNFKLSSVQQLSCKLLLCHVVELVDNSSKMSLFSLWRWLLCLESFFFSDFHNYV